MFLVVFQGKFYLDGLRWFQGILRSFRCASEEISRDFMDVLGFVLER